MKTGAGNSTTARSGDEPVSFIRRNAGEIREGGLPVLFRKVRTFFSTVLLRIVLLVFLPVVLVEYALQPLVHVRFGHLISKHIGAFAGYTELYFCRRDAGMDDRRTFDIFFHNGSPCNRQLKIMWERKLHVTRLARPLYFLNRYLPGGRRHMVWPPYGERDIHGLLPRFPAHLSFTPEEERRGQEELRSMGIPEGVPFVCFYSRDTAYYKTATPEDYTVNQDYRDSSIQNYLSAAEELTARGYYAVRMGAFVNEALTAGNDKIIDYATRYRSDFMDIYLCARCSFFLGDQAGLTQVAVIFRRPMAYVNSIPLEHVPAYGPDNLFIPKRLWLKQEERFLTFRKMFAIQPDGIRLSDLRQTEQYERLGIVPVENTPEEIAGLAVEMDERINGRWQSTGDDEELQQRFWSLFKAGEGIQGVIASRIGAEFLRRNRELLE